MIIFGCTNRQIHFRNGEIHSFDSYPKLDLDFKPQSLDSKNLDWDLVWEPQAARGSRRGPGVGSGLQTPIIGFKELGLKLGLGTSSCTWIETWTWSWTWNPKPQAASGSKPGPGIGFGLQTPIVGFKEPGLRPSLGTSSCTWIETWTWTWTWNPNIWLRRTWIEVMMWSMVCLSATCGFCHRKWPVLLACVSPLLADSTIENAILP